MPVGLDKRVQKVWHRVVPKLCERGLYDPLDADVIVQYCTARAEADILKAEVARFGRVGRRKEAAVVNPFWTMWMQAEDFALKLAGVIGLTSKARLRSPPPATKESRVPRPLLWNVTEDDVTDVSDGGGG